jgi:hypothetical protein
MTTLKRQKTEEDEEVVCLRMVTTGDELVWLIGSGPRENWREASPEELAERGIHVLNDDEEWPFE